MNYAEFATQDLRLVMLRAMHAAAQYRVNAFLLRRYCDAVGHTVTADKLATELAWLKEQGYIVLERAEGVDIATLTARGADIATGAASVPGVARPQPGF